MSASEIFGYESPPMLYSPDERYPCPVCGHLLEWQDEFNLHCLNCDEPYSAAPGTDYAGREYTFIYTAWGHPAARVKKITLTLPEPRVPIANRREGDDQPHGDERTMSSHNEDRVCGALGCTSTYDIQPADHPQRGIKWLCPTHREDYMGDVDDYEHP